MKIRTIRLYPFGFFNSKSLEFNENLNIILGENEAGKTTIFNAIQKVLFVQSNLRKKEFEEKILRWLPVNGGDTVKVELTFEHDEDEYTVRRAWGLGLKQDELKLPDGNIYTDPFVISDKLNGFLLTNEGTYNSVLMTYQSGITKIINDIEKEMAGKKKEERVITESLKDALDRPLMQTDGISIEKFNNKIEKLLNEYILNWDLDNSMPYSKKTGGFYLTGGSLVKKYHELNESRKKYRLIHSMEDASHSLTSEKNMKEREAEETHEFISSNKKFVENIQKKELLNEKNRRIEEEIEELNEIKNEWPELKKDKISLDKEYQKNELEKQSLNEKKDKLLKFREYREIKSEFDHLEELRNEHLKSEENLKSVQFISEEDLEKIRKLDRFVEVSETSLKSSKITINFSTNKNTEIKVKRPSENPEKVFIEANKGIILNANGQIGMLHEDWLMNIRSGEIRTEVLDDIEKCKKLIKIFFDNYSINSIKEAENIYTQYLRLNEHRERALNVFSNNGGYERYEELKEKMKEAPTDINENEYDYVHNRLVELSGKQSSIQSKIESIEKILEEYEAQYISIENINIILKDKNKEKTSIFGQLCELKDVPDGINADSLIEEYNRKEENLLKINKEINEANIEIGQINGQLSLFESAEELKIIVDEKSNEFDSIEKESIILEYIKDMSDEIYKEMSTDPYYELKLKVLDYLSTLTSGNFVDISEMNKCLPTKIKKKDGSKLGLEYLSEGTKDALSLAIRLAYADYFLGKDGFLIMDDPLVDMDPSRQKNAARILREISKDHQIIIFTCHPSHAEIFEVEPIKL